MIKQQMWKRLGKVEQLAKPPYPRFVRIISEPPETEEELDNLIERWKAGEPMERFGGAYDEDVNLIIVRIVAPEPRRSDQKRRP